MASVQRGVQDLSAIVLTIVMYALVIGSILGASAFATITIINVTALSETYGLAIVALTGFFVVGCTILGILWFVKYARQLLSKKGGLTDMTA